jgi:hypothetical protein
MPAIKNLPAIKPKKFFTIPQSVRDDEDARSLWKWALSNYELQAADRLALTMLCHAWSEYTKHYRSYHSAESGGKGSATSPMTAWFDRVCKLMFWLNMMPSQRGTSPGMDGRGGPETRGADGTLPGIGDEGEE